MRYGSIDLIYIFKLNSDLEISSEVTALTNKYILIFNDHHTSFSFILSYELNYGMR